MRSLVLSFTMLTAFAAAPAMAQMQQNYASPPYGAPAPYGAGMGEQHAPPSHQPVSPTPTNINGQDTRSLISPSLPSPHVGPDADATRYLRAARTALQRNRTGEAQEALENAETFLLNRSVPQGAVNDPDQSPSVRNINSALQALAANDRGRTLQLIDQTLSMAGNRPGMTSSMNNGAPGSYQNGSYQSGGGQNDGYGYNNAPSPPR